MPTIVRLRLRHDAFDHSRAEGDEFVLGYEEDIDLDKLTPRARAIAEAIAQSGGRPVDIWMERDRPLRETMPNWEMWYSPERAEEPERRPWKNWSRYPATSRTEAHAWLEEQAQKLPPEWHVLGARPDTPVPSREAGAADRYLTRDQVLAYMRARGRDISVSTWSSYTARKQAPRPDRYVGRTPQWLEATIDSFLAGEWRAAEDA